MIISLNDLGLLIQIITNIFLIVGGIIAVWQYLSSKHNETYHYNKDQIHLAIEIAEYYKENVIWYSRDLKNIVGNIGLFDVSEDIKLEDIQYFDVAEIKEVYTKKQLKKIKETRAKYNIDKYVEEQSISYRAMTQKEAASRLNDNLVIDSHTSESEQKTREVGNQYTELMFKISNNLEVFSMYFVHGVADESVIYQPLHMSFLEIVRLLYYDISYANRSGAMKFYINTIKLFNIWKDKSLKQEEAETDTMRSIAEEGKILQKIYDKYNE